MINTEKVLLEILQNQAKLDACLARVEENLKEHMRRTHNVEGVNLALQEHVNELKIKMAKAQGAIALLSLLSVVFGLALTISKLLP